jgi:hypothetical protein
MLPLRRLTRRTFGSLVLALTTLFAPLVEGRQQVFEPQARNQGVVRRRIPQAAREGALAFVRTELFFGTAKPQGVVTEAEFRAFVDEHITSRFPDGLTVLKGDGQFRGEDDITIKEQSFVLILLYPYDGRHKSSRKVNEIREIYKDQFQQQSVLRVDDPFIVWVSF